MDVMKRAIISGIKQISIIDSPIPLPKENWVLVKVRAIPLCTEYKNWINGTRYDGHEASGEVVAVARHCNARVGDRVAVMPSCPCGRCELCIAGDYIHCENSDEFKDTTFLDNNGDTHAQYLIKQDWLLAPIPDGVSFELGALACCGLGPTFGALERFNANSFNVVLITGAGPVGLGGIVNAKYRGSKVISVDTIPYRRNKAKELGADLVLDTADDQLLSKIKLYTFGKGVDIALETAGNNEAARTCLDALRCQGNMAFIGQNGDLTINVSNDFIRKGIRVSGQWHYNLNGISKIMEVIKDSPIVAKLITHHFPMSKMNEALKISATLDCGKIILDPWS